MPAPVQITLGRSIVQLDGPWKFHVGDSPNSAGEGSPLWSRPDFDDSKWESISLSPVAGSTSPFDDTNGWVPGWEANGHFGYWGYAWYRIRVHLAASRDTRLAIEGPAHIDDGYQLFANGLLVGSFGKFSSGTTQPVVYQEQPQFFLLPGLAGETSASDSTTQVLAFRVWMSPASLNDLSGGMHNAPTFGEADAVKAHYRLSWIDRFRGSGFTLITALLFLLLAIVAASINFFDRTDPVYWWVMSVFLIMTLGATETVLGTLTQSRSMFADSLMLQGLFFPLWLFGWVMVWWVWFRLRRPSWIPRLITGLTLLYMISELPHCRLGVAIPGWVSMTSSIASVSIRFSMLLVLLYIVVRGVKAQGREGWLALPAIILTVAATFSDDLYFSTMFIRLGIRPFWLLFGMQVTLLETAQLISSMIMFVLLLRRLLFSVRRQREMALDVMQAQEVQHVLLPESIHVPGLRIETEYRPAREVGGDFFQVLPQQEDGSVLIVAGDVTGKGLQAGMLVALLVGAIRSTAEGSGDPRMLLEALNRRLLGRGSAHATCLAMRIESDGAVTLANAGHLAPYLNGEEVEMEGALPLGMMEGAEFPVSHFKFNPGDTLTLISDGVLEAQSKSGQLFGFDRVRDLLRTKISAAGIARAAQEFGQEDDISVVSVTRSI